MIDNIVVFLTALAATFGMIVIFIGPGVTLFWRRIARILARPAVADWLIARAMRTPYSPIIKDGVLYMDRFWLFNPYPDTGGSGADRPRRQFPISIRIHHILEPDQDRHPWRARTIILRGWYREDRAGASYVRLAGDTATLSEDDFHRITHVSSGGVWTMSITGRYHGTWGFDVDGVKVPWRKYLGVDK